MSSHSSHHSLEVLLAQFSLCVHKGFIKPHSFISFYNKCHFFDIKEIECSHLYIIIIISLVCYSPMFRRSYVQKVRCSEGSMFRRSFVQKVLCSESSIFRRFYIQKVLCSEGPMVRNICSEGPMVRKYVFHCQFQLGTQRFCDVESTSMTLIQCRKNVVCPVGFRA